MSLVKSYINRIVFHIFGIIFGPVVVHFSGFQIARNILIFYSCILIIFFGFIEIYKLYKKEKNSSRKFTFIYSVISLTVLLIGCLHSDNIIRYGAMLDDTMNAIFQTDLLEAIYYIVNNISFFGILLFMTWYSTMIFSYLYVSTFNIKSLESSFISYFLGLVTIFGLFGANIYSKEAYQIYYEAKEYKNILKNYSPSREKILGDNNINNFSTNFLGNIIVVLGESTSRHHMGIYNYFRNTTPNMIMRKNEIALFNNIISTHSHTVQSIIDALTLNKRKERKSLNEVVDIITLMKAANFNVSWISNQNAASLFDSHVAAIAKQSDLTQYYSSQKNLSGQKVFDDSMSNTLEKVLSNNNDNNFVIIHTMAGHTPYCRMIPNSFCSKNGDAFQLQVDERLIGQFKVESNSLYQGLFTRVNPSFHKNLINCYDSAILYIDYTINRFIEIAEDEDSPTLLIYISDHGEAPLLGTSHDSRLHSHFHVEIPLIVWANNSFKYIYEEKWRDIKANVNKPGSLIDFSYSIADLAGIKIIKDIKQRSFFSSNYNSFDRTTLHEKINYDQGERESDYSERTRSVLSSIDKKYGPGTKSRIWAHRVNTFGSMIEARDLFSGIELDLVFDNDVKKFFIYVSPADNINLTLTDYLRQDNNMLNYWLDWKNASETNMLDALNQLDVIDKKYNIRKRAIIETMSPNSLTYNISKQNWVSSYYLPTDSLRKYKNDKNEINKTNLSTWLLKQTIDHNFTAVSFDLNYYEFFSKYLLESINKLNLKVFGWKTSVQIDKQNAINRLEPFISEFNVDVILVSFPSPFDL